MISIKQHGGSFWTLEGSIKGGTNSAKRVLLPKYSEDLAEFIGIMLGDGGISHGQITVTLGFTTDKEYVPYVMELIYKLFNILGFKVAISGRTIYLCGKEQVKRYVKEIGFSNPKHLSRYQNFLQTHSWSKVKSKNCLSFPPQV